MPCCMVSICCSCRITRQHNTLLLHTVQELTDAHGWLVSLWYTEQSNAIPFIQRTWPILLSKLWAIVGCNIILCFINTSNIIFPSSFIKIQLNVAFFLSLHYRFVNRYWFRSLNPRKLIELNFSSLPRQMNLQRARKLNRLPEVCLYGALF